MYDIGELRLRAMCLAALLADPQPGLATWNKAVAESVEHLNRIYNPEYKLPLEMAEKVLDEIQMNHDCAGNWFRAEQALEKINLLKG